MGEVGFKNSEVSDVWGVFVCEHVCLSCVSVCVHATGAYGAAGGPTVGSYGTVKFVDRSVWVLGSELWSPIKQKCSEQLRHCPGPRLWLTEQAC